MILQSTGFDRVRALAATSIALLGFATCEPTFGQQRFTDFVAHVPESNTEVLAIHDPAAHLQVMLASPALDRAWQSSGLADTAGGRILNPQAGLNWLEANRQTIPTSIVISADQGIYDLFRDYFRAMLLVNMHLYVAAAGESVPFEEQELLESELLEIATELELPDITASARWNDEETAKQLFALTVMQLQVAAGQFDLDFKETGEQSYLLKGEVGDFLEQEYFGNLLDQLSIQNSEELAARIVKIEFQAALRRDENAIRVSIGAEPEEWSAASDFPDVQDGPGEIAWCRWNFQKMREAGRQLGNDLNYWADTVIGETFRAVDSEDLWRTNTSLVDQMAMLPENGRMRFWREESRVLADIEQSGVAAAPDLRNSSLAKRVPDNAEIKVVSATVGISETLYATLENFEERLAMRSLRNDISGDANQAGINQLITDVYYSHFSGAREVVFNDFAKIDSKPAAFIVNTDGKLKVTISPTGSNDESRTIETSDFPQFAMVCETTDGAALAIAFEDLYHEIVQGTLESSDAALLDSIPLVADSKLDLPGTVREFDFDWLRRADLADLSFEGDFKSHYFLVDGLFVFSTSPELSRQIASQDFKTIEFTAGAHPVTQFGVIPGRSMGKLFRELMRFLMRGMDHSGDLPDQDLSSRVVQQTESVLDGLMEIAALLKECRWETQQQNDQTNTLFVLEFQYE